MQFQQSVVHIGSDPGNDFQLTDPEVSAYHGQIACGREAGHYAYRDLQSTHGTRVRSSSIDVLLFSQQLAQSVALTGECMLFLGQSMVRCAYLSGAAAEQRRVRRVQTCPLHPGIIIEDRNLLAFLLETALALSNKTTHEAVLASLALVVMQHAETADHVAMWRYDSFRGVFVCAYERARQNEFIASNIGDVEFLDAIRSRAAHLYSATGQPDTGCAIVVPLFTFARELGVLVVESNRPDGFVRETLDTLARIAGVAVSAIERTFLNTDMSAVFDGFVRSIIAVMDARDPASAGHSMRVAKYAVYTAQAIHASQHPAFLDVSFSKNHLDELRYASMLHDIGKVVLRREILLKAAKIAPPEFEHLLERIDLFAAWFASQPPEMLGDAYRPPQRFGLYREVVTRVVRAQSLAAAADREIIDEMSRTFITPCPELPLLKPQERESLLIERGTLNREERREIRRHALISWQYLSQITWPQRWANVPIFVLQHHEKLNGSGYPYGISGDQIFLQSRIITVCDIFDALTGGDRLYKTRHSFGDAASILRQEAAAGELDPNVVDLFIASVIPQISDPELAG